MNARPNILQKYMMQDKYGERRMGKLQKCCVQNHYLSLIVVVINLVMVCNGNLLILFGEPIVFLLFPRKFD